MRRFVAVLSFTGIAVIAGLFTPLLATAACPVDNPECHKLPPPPPPIPPSPPTPSPSATGVFRIDVYRSILDQAGEYILRKYRQEGKPGTLSWAGPPPTRCGHGCVDAPVMTVWGYAETYGFLNFHWDSGSWGVWQDVSIWTELDAVCVNWQTGQGRLRLYPIVHPIALAGDGKGWLIGLWDFFTDNSATDAAINLANQWLTQALQSFSGNLSMDLGTCRSLGVHNDPSGSDWDAFVWDP
jgi:hypothetical protein